MTVSQLIERLEEYRKAMGDDIEVRLMTQQEWPFENTILGVASGEEINATDDAEEDEDVDDENVVYIVERDQLGYGSKRAWEIAY